MESNQSFTFDQRYRSLLDTCLDSLNEWKAVIENYVDIPDRAKELEAVKHLTENYCHINNDYRKHMGALKVVEDNLKDPETEYDIDQMLAVEKSRQVVDEDVSREEVWEQIFNPDASVSEVVARTNDQLSNSQYEIVDGRESLLCSYAFTLPVDPITKAVIKKPFRNKQCKHVYEYDSIINYIHQRKRRAKCPYIGCSSPLVISNLHEDVALTQEIAEYLEAHSQNDSDSDS